MSCPHGWKLPYSPCPYCENPNYSQIGSTSKLVELDQNMMRKVDFFAGQIMASLVDTHSKYSEAELARMAVRYAQALVEELRQ